MLTGFIPSIAYLTAPIVNPLTKYFWKNGYAIMIGKTPTKAIAICTVSVGIFASAPLAAEDPRLLLLKN
jgi:hypothetical protein